MTVSTVEDGPLCVFVDVPICAFRPYESREYQDSYPVPPPSAVYGMLLSLTGLRRDDLARHRGAVVVLALETEPERSRVFRKLRRGKDLEDIRPDYQDLLIGLRLWLWLDDGDDCGTPTLRARVAQALTDPASVDRFGGLSLGESSYLVNAVQVRRAPPLERLRFLRPDPNGFHHLPVWVDHQDAAKSIRQRFDLSPLPVRDGVSSCRVTIGGSP